MSNVMICDDLYSFMNTTQKAELNRKNEKENSLSKELRNIVSELDQNEMGKTELGGRMKQAADCLTQAFFRRID